MSGKLSLFTSFGPSENERPLARRPHAALYVALAGMTAMSLLSGCPTEGNLGELTFEQIDDGAFDRTLDGENGDSFLDTGRWAVGSELRIRIETDDPSAALPSLDCHAEDEAIFATAMEGVDILNVITAGEGISRIECYQDGTETLIDFITMIAAVPYEMSTLVRVPAPYSRVSVDSTGLVLQMVEGGAVDVALGMLDIDGNHLRGNILVNATTTDAAVAELLVDTYTNPDVLSNQFFVVSAGVAGPATINAALSTDATVLASLDVDVITVGTIYDITGTFLDVVGNELDLLDPIPEGALLFAEAFLTDQSAVWGGEFLFTILTPTTIALTDPIAGSTNTYAQLLDVLATGPASIELSLPASAAPPVTIDFDVELP